MPHDKDSPHYVQFSTINHMETNQNSVQEQPAERLYDPAEAAQIVRILTDGYFNPEYILLFGKLVGGTPHSDAAAYDLLVVVRDTPEYDWIRAKRILRYRMPYRYRKVSYINPYILPLNYVESHRTPFLYFAHAEGELLHCSDHYRFRRPKHPIDFAKAHADAKFHFDTFRWPAFLSIICLAPSFCSLPRSFCTITGAPISP